MRVQHQEQNPLRKLAIISMTAVVKSDQRYQRALQAKKTYQSQFPAAGSGEMTWAINSYFQTLHDPTLLYLDEFFPVLKGIWTCWRSMAIRLCW